MQAWHRLISNDKSKILDFVDHFESELIEARKELRQAGRIEQMAQNIPCFHEERFGQLQQVETVLEVLEIELKKLKSEKFKILLEGYKRALSSRDCEKYVDGDIEVVDLSTVIAEVSYIRNQLLGVVKSLEMKSYSIGHIVRLRTAGIEDATL